MALPAPHPLSLETTLLPDIFEDHEEEEDRMSNFSTVDSPSIAPQRGYSGENNHDLQSVDEEDDSLLDDVDNTEDYDTDIEINEDELLEKKDMKDSDVGAGEYKRSCSRLHISPENRVVENLSSNTLNLAYQGVGEDGVKALSKSLLKNTKVEKLKLEDNLITPLGVTFIADMLCDNIYITYLDLSHNDVGTYGSFALKEMLIYNSSLLTLIINDCQIKDSDCVVLAEGVQRNETVVYIDLGRNELCEEGALCLGNAIAINNSIEQLSLAWNHIRRKGAVQICKGLKRNYCLVKIDLSWNGLGYDGALSLGQALKTNKYIREMDISSNRLTWKCASVIAAGLKDNDALEVLKVGLNPLTMTGVLELLSAVNNQRSEMEYMSFEGIPINRKIAYIAETLSNSREFSIDHGGILETDDIMGKKVVIEDDPLTRLMAFLNDRGIRAVDLFRTLETDKDRLVSREQFIAGLKKAQVPLETWEMVKVMEKLDKAEQGKINYRKLNLGLQEQKKFNKLKENKAKADALKKRRDERKLLNPEQLHSSRAGSVIADSGTASSSRRASRISLNISQSISDLRRGSTASILSFGSSAASPSVGGGASARSALAAAVNVHQKDAREGEMMRKLNRLSLPSDSRRPSNAARSGPSSRKGSLASQAN